MSVVVIPDTRLLQGRHGTVVKILGKKTTDPSCIFWMM
jgi:hypothetical protein